MLDYKEEKIKQHSKANRIKGMVNIRARNQQHNIYQQEHKKQVKIPQMVIRKTGLHIHKTFSY